MRLGFRFACLLAALLLPQSLAAAAGLPVAKQTLSLTTKAIEATIEYPRTGNAAIDATLLAYARRSLAEYKGYGAGRRPDQGAYSLDTSYEVERNDGKMFAVVFTEDAFTGGAHPSHQQVSFDFLLPDGAQVFLPEILDGARGIAALSRLATADLIKNIASGPEPASDAETITSGAGPLADNFKVFVWLPNKLHLYFPEYQVASYAAGPQEASIPLAALKDVIRPDWRAPAPSFDCSKIVRGNMMTVEQTICADAALARLDRQVAETYFTNLHNAYEPGAADKLKQAQRAWLAKRNATCVLPVSVVCLTKLYGERLAVLKKS